MLKLFILLVLTSTACGPSKQCVEHGIPSDFVPYYEIFHKETGIDPSCTDIKFVESFPEKDMVGLCELPDNIVSVNKKAWDNYNDDEREMLISHELGHCVLDKEHEEETMIIENYKEPKSIMYPYMTGAKFFYKHKKEYYNELMTGKFALPN